MSAAAAKLHRIWQTRGTAAALRMVFSRVVLHRRHVVFDADLGRPYGEPEWAGGERLLMLGPGEIDAAMTPALGAFLGGDEAADNIVGVRGGDLLFVVEDDGRYLHCGYVFFNAKGARLIGETDNPPLIGCCLTAADARGRGLYRKALQAELACLARKGFRRAVIETDPENLASRRGIEAAGFGLLREADTWTVLNILVFRRSKETAGGRKWSVSLL